jgi:predicted Rossmann fold nucleotide-binding protein DprA/Smf involved in DNA uptake
MTTATHADRMAAILLCSHLALPRGESAAKPLSAAQWHGLLAKLGESGGAAPGDLFGLDAAAIEAAARVKPESAERIARLLDRGGQAAIVLEQLDEQGMWVLTEADAAYPTRLTQRLGEQAPPVLFGAGPVERLGRGGVAIVGSRDLDAAGAAFAGALGGRCGGEGVAVVSGAARGTDMLAMLAGAAAGGGAVGVAAEGLERLLRGPEYGPPVREGRVTLVTPFQPAAGFSIGNAMARNKLIYGLAELAVVVAATSESGGTWAGAVENLTRGWAPLFVRAGADAPPGNQELLSRGGLPLTLDALPPAGALLRGLLTRAGGLPPEPEPLPCMPVGGNASSDDRDLFAVVWPALASFLAAPRTMREIAAAFALEPAQVKAWLARAEREGRVEASAKGPRRYQQPAPRLL